MTFRVVVPSVLLIVALAVLWTTPVVRTQDRTMTTEAEFLQAMEDLSNWGRWGADDELGASNLISPEKRREAAALVTEGSASRWRTTSRKPRRRMPAPFSNAKCCV